MRGEKFNAAIALIAKYVTESGIRSNDMFVLAKYAGISGRTLERAKYTVGDIKTGRDSQNKRLWILEKHDRENLLASMSDCLDLPIKYIETVEQTESGENGIAEPFITTLYRSEHNQSDEVLDLSELKRIFLIPQRIIFRGKYDYFAGYVPDVMEANAVYGDAFIFCNRSKSEIALLQWQGDGYALFFKRSEYGRFPWPANTGAAAVEIMLGDLQMLIEYPKMMMRLSGKSMARYIM
jgi:hypothetical protein